MNQTNKATHEPYNTELFAPVMKEASGNYIAVLSDTSVDRDEERVGKSALLKIKNNFGYVAGLIDHENKVLNQVCEWVNKRITDIDGHTALVAEPKFFLSNPNAKVIKGMLDEGAQIGISIGAIVKEYEDQKVNNKSIRTFTDLELLEASFVAIPSNRHGRAMAVAKSFKTSNKKMSEEKYTQEDVDSAVLEKTKSFKTEVSDLNKQLESKSLEVTKLKKDLEAKDEEVKEVNEKLEETNKKLEETKESLEKAKKVAIDKQKFAESTHKLVEMSDEDVNKAFSEGKLPISRY